MAIALTLLPQNMDGSADNLLYAIVTLALTGNYTTGGDTLDLTQIGGILPSQTPLQVFVSSAGDASSFGAGLGGYFTIIPGATLATWKLKMWSAGGAELANGAYPASLSVAGAHEALQLNITARKLL